jgi:Ca-activated chloride channel homolog
MFNDWNIAFWEYDFLSPYFLWFLVLIPFLWLQKNQNKEGFLKFSRPEIEQISMSFNWIKYLRWTISFLYGIVLALMILAMSKPVHWSSNEDFDNDFKHGIDIILSMDVSVSMLARDFSPNRLEASKKVAKEFVSGRKGDRIGLVAYEAEAFTVCPATLDYEVLKQKIDQLQPGMMEGGTAIGIGLGTAVTRLRNDSLPSKVIILLTDGVNNQGDISPETAAELAKAKNIRVYTIGVGSLGMAPSPVFTPFGVRYENAPVEIDEITLSKIASTTGGKYFRATDEQSLRKIYQEIDVLEKRKIKDIDYKTEPPINPLPYLNWAFVIFALTWFTQKIVFKTND